ncbi:hypothetical protein ASF11_11655 [Acidovorax sp. Leaf76]|nr:hypothetical protein ASF11_11655 [Acidovorax sp. Leaf76]KQO32028.1 hypothetical protein ASF19_10830 [Acidovorax sp. Leaf84]KQS29092.1 hypothetical protein ASG27_12715 [Acidovorax sp. Leaf191]
MQIRLHAPGLARRSPVSRMFLLMHCQRSTARTMRRAVGAFFATPARLKMRKLRSQPQAQPKLAAGGVW